MWHALFSKRGHAFLKIARHVDGDAAQHSDDLSLLACPFVGQIASISVQYVDIVMTMFLLCMCVCLQKCMRVSFVRVEAARSLAPCVCSTSHTSPIFLQVMEIFPSSLGDEIGFWISRCLPSLPLNLFRPPPMRAPCATWPCQRTPPCLIVSQLGNARRCVFFWKIGVGVFFMLAKLCALFVVLRFIFFARSPLYVDQDGAGFLIVSFLIFWFGACCTLTKRCTPVAH